MKAKCAVSFEYQMRAPETWEGEVEGFTAPPIVRRATEAAIKAIKPRNWSSMVIVIKERTGVENESEESTIISESI